MEGKGAWALMAALWLVECTAAFETAMLYASMGALMKAFGDPVKVGWIMSVYLLVGAAAGAVIGRLGDIYGRRRLMLMLMGATVFASVLSASTSLFGVILVGRALQGLAAATLPLNFGLLRENLPGERVPFGVGVVMSGSSSGIALGLVAGGAVVDRFGWHSVFIVSAVLAVASLALVRAVVPPSPQNREAGARLDWSSIALFGPAIVALLVAISNGSAWGWTSAATLALAAAGIGSLTLWTVRSLRHAAPLIDLRLFANRSVVLANISFALLSLGGLQVSMIFSLLLQTPTWTGVGLGVSAAMAGVLQLPGSLVGMIAGPAAGIAMQRLGGGAVMLFGGLIAALGWTVACAWHGSTFGVMLLVLFINTGTFFIYAAGPVVVMENVPAARTSEATGMLAVIRAVSMGVGAQVASVLLATSTVGAPGATRYPDASAFLLTFIVITSLCFMAAFVAWMLPKAPRTGLGPSVNSSFTGNVPHA